MTKLFAVILTLALIVAGCGSASTDIKGGATKMRATLVEVKKAVDSGDEATAKTKSEGLEDSWSKFEDAVKDKDKTLYADIEEPLGIIEAGTKKAQMDQKAILDAVAKLDGLLEPLTK